MEFPGHGKRPANLVQTIERVSHLLHLLGDFPNGANLKDLTELVGLPKGTTHRLLNSLAYYDYVRQDAKTGRYRLGLKLVELGNALIQRLDFRQEGRPVMYELARRTNETIHLVILDQGEIFYLEKVSTSSSGLQMMSYVGMRNTVHSSSVGKVLLAGLPVDEARRIVDQRPLTAKTPNTITDPERLMREVRRAEELGYAIDDEENEIGVRCVAAPIRSAEGRVVAALSISGPSIRMSPENCRGDFKALVMEAARSISKNLGCPG